jgi:catechol 2,3-dioxygenase-like lactoylglutathione lyase family enzyme
MPEALPLWRAKLRGLVMTARDPAPTAAYWSQLLGGSADGSTVCLAGGTRIEVMQGETEGLAEQRFDAADSLLVAARRLGAETERAGDVTLTDRDGWTLRLRPVEEVAPLELHGPVLSHCTLNSPSPPRQRSFYEELAFSVSDQLGDIFCWLRPNPVHHSIAFAVAEQACINHIAIELPDRASFIEAIDHVIAAGLKLEFGPGRHMVGGNLFAYFRDRYRLRWELCAEMARLSRDHRPGILTAGDRGRSVNTYGPPPPASFIEEPGGPPPVATPTHRSSSAAASSATIASRT